MTQNHCNKTRCQVCGFSEVRTDEVLDDGVMLLAECPRCEHRWTQRTEQLPRTVSVRHTGKRLEFDVQVAA
jgi:uncharacterized Zn finger protein